jgi:methylenetetrahydrofolate dehydrogenase (NADP+)/methenyltetrahydrofolate cyclohydrolase
LTKKEKNNTTFPKNMLLDGKKTAQNVLERLKPRIESLNNRNIKPKLVIIMVGKNPASLSYIRQKRKFCESIGVLYEQRDFSEDVTTKELISEIKKINEDDSIHGVIVQLPLPEHIESPLIFRSIEPKKDVDGFTAYNIGKMFLSTEFEHLPPATPKGIARLLEEHDIDVTGKEVVIVGHSNIVGKPIAIMLLNRNATVTVCHRDTKDLKEHTKKADILIVAVGKTNLITEDMVKDGVVIIDVGINKVDDESNEKGYKLVGDVDFEAIEKKASYITPVPGGVGPMTVASLVENVVAAAERLSEE